MATGSQLQQQINQLFRLVQASKLPAELTLTNRATDKDERLVIQKGENDATNIKIQHLRGFLGDYNASTNTATLPDSSLSFSPTDAVGIAGDWLRVTTGGTVNFGSGNIVLESGDTLEYDGTIWKIRGRIQTKPAPFEINVAVNDTLFIIPGAEPEFIHLEVDRVPQIPGVDYTLSGNEINMTETVYSGSWITGIAYY